MFLIQRIARITTIGIAVLWAGPVLAACPSLLPNAVTFSVAAKRTITARDLIELRDIGDPASENSGLPARLAVSPDGRFVAFSLIRADLAGNGHCIGVFISPISSAGSSKEVNAGGELLPDVDNLRGYRTPSGSNLPIIPVWSHDGRKLAFLRRDHGVTQAWVVGADGADAKAVTRFAADATALAWSSDGRRLIVATRPAIAETLSADAQEGRSGWLYDARMTPEFQTAPMVAADKPRVLFSVDLETEKTEISNPADAAAMPVELPPGTPVAPQATATDGQRAWTERSGGGLIAPLVLFTSDRTGRKAMCASEWCTGGITGLWWDPHGGALFVLRRQGWDKEETALYRWQLGRRAPRVVFRTHDVVQDCGWGATGLVCTRESSTAPRTIVVINRRSGDMREIFDPNPEFSNIRLGSVRRLRVRNALGLASWGDLVLPNDRPSGQKLPLIVVQYHSQGFLRGGTGDEYPIFLLAAHGYAVLSLERPASFAAAYPNIKTAFELNQMDLKNWAERRSLLSSVLATVDQAVATGLINDRKIGISGLSDGSSTVRFAMINSHRFAAASISTCCFEPKSVITYDGIALSDYLLKMGFPPSTKNDADFWRAYSLAVSGGQTNTPLLMQLADREFTSGLEAFQALREYHKGVELYVFPNEYHVKWQPEHRLAIYQRNIDWFDFWLRDKEDPDPVKRAQYDRWKKMRAELASAAR